MKSYTFSSTILKRKSDCSIINIFHVISHDKVMMKILLLAKHSVSSAYFYEKYGKLHFCMTSHSPFYKSNSCYRFLIFRYRRVKTCNCYISLFCDYFKNHFKTGQTWLNLYLFHCSTSINMHELNDLIHIFSNLHAKFIMHNYTE